MKTIMAVMGLVCMTMSSIHAQGCASAPLGLVGWWKGDGTSVDVVSSNNGVLVNVGFTNGVVGQAFSFDPENLPYGTYSGVEIADQPAYTLTNSLTIEGWVRPRGDGYLIFFRGDHRPGLDPYALSMQGNSTVDFAITDANGNSAIVGTSLVYNQWTHLAATLDGGSGTMSLYTNGQLAAQTVTTIRPFGALEADQSPGVGIGNVNDGGNNFPFLGDIDEISLYSHALTPTKIQAIYNAGSAGKCTLVVTTNNCVTPPAGIVGWWPAEGNANDIIGGDNGTLEGGATFAPGEVGLGFRFDGTNGYVQIPDSAALKPANVTVEAWIWLDPNVSPSSNEQIIFKQNSWSYYFEGYTILKAHIDNGNGTFTDHFQSVVSANGNQIAINSITAVQRGVWYHVATTYDGNQLTLYVNGVAEASAIAGFPLDYGTEPVFIGTTGVPGVYINMFAGIIDEASIYNRALASNEIAAIYNAGSAGKCTTASLAVPVISSLSPSSGANGTVVTISGNNFSPTPAANIVYFGAVQAVVSSASPTNLVVTVPVGATFAPVNVTVNGLTAYSSQFFGPTFTGDGSSISTTSFSPSLRCPVPAARNPWSLPISTATASRTSRWSTVTTTSFPFTGTSAPTARCWRRLVRAAPGFVRRQRRHRQFLPPPGG